MDATPSSSGSTPGEQPKHLVHVDAFAIDPRRRLVSINGAPHVLMTREEFERRVHEAFPNLDLNDPEQTYWVDSPGGWPVWDSEES
ncbi:hypothetical protein ABIA33_003451 [Streptacidiphilus sp. MAP12-16]|uniref:hypothetical protein n=1 Tax=Streptacidiphilus sp. MAP12-16 TaxID=3156300 RepID=UPI00351501D7